jgi:hypothetical protein
VTELKKNGNYETVAQKTGNYETVASNITTHITQSVHPSHHSFGCLSVRPTSLDLLLALRGVDLDLRLTCHWLNLDLFLNHCAATTPV